MGETAPTSWTAGVALLAFCIAILVIGWRFGGGQDQPVKHNLSCQAYGDRYECVESP